MMLNKKEENKTITDKFIKELQQRIRAGFAGIFIRTYEERRILKAIEQTCNIIDRKMYIWDYSIEKSQDLEGNINTKTLIKLLRKENQIFFDVDEIPNLLPIFTSKCSKKSVLCLMDFQYFFYDQIQTIRSIKNCLPRLKEDGKTVIFIGPQLKIPEELDKDIIILDFPLPGREELMDVLDYVLKCTERTSPDKKIKLSEENKNKLCEAALGLTAIEAEDAFSLTFTKNYIINKDSIKTVLDEKCAIIKKDEILEYLSPEIKIDHVGGLAVLKRWLLKRINAFSIDARNFGLPNPKGILMVGIPGCGKSLVAKMIASLFGVPLLRLDMGKVYQKFMGESEGMSRKSIKIAEALAPCVFWLDEIEKGFSGIKSADETSGGVPARVAQTYLTWMQEKTSPVFIAATANDVTKLPPELIRKGRFDEIFFVSLPNLEERIEIVDIQVRKYGIKDENGKIIERKLPIEDIKKIADASSGYSGSEIEGAIVCALYECYNDNKRDLKAEDVIKAIVNSVPLSKTMEYEIAALKKWGETRAKNASKLEGK